EGCERFAQKSAQQLCCKAAYLKLVGGLEQRQSSLCHVKCRTRPRQPPRVCFELLQPPWVAQQVGYLVCQGADVIRFDRRAVFQQEITIAELLTWRRIDDNHRRAAGQCFRSRKTARLGHD